MAIDEFQLIRSYFDWSNHKDVDALITVGDDAAIIKPNPYCEWAVSVDTSIEEVHFPRDAEAAAIAYKALSVNLSDMAAMGAQPRWFTLSLGLPTVDENWIKAFAQSLKTLSKDAGVTLIGGDTTRSPVISISIQIIGELPKGQRLLRSGAQADDLIIVSGHLGDAAAGLDLHRSALIVPNVAQKYCMHRLHYPCARHALGCAVLNTAHSSIDLSDGLMADLQHILDASGMGAELHTQSIPLSPELIECSQTTYAPRSALEYALSGGDDYELLFTIPKEQWLKVQAIAENLNTTVTHIGCITAQHRQIQLDGKTTANIHGGYKHF